MMLGAAENLLPGLPDPVFDSQRAFRAALDALARPGSIVEIPQCVSGPAPLTPTATALALTLADFETPLWLQSRNGAAADYLRFHCGCPIVADPAAACFALVHDARALPPLSSFDAGRIDYPDRSATLIVQVAALRAGSGVSFAGAGVKLRGPGIREHALLEVVGLPARFWKEWRENTQLFPRGVDVILVADGHIAGLPRTTQVEI